MKVHRCFQLSVLFLCEFNTFGGLCVRIGGGPYRVIAEQKVIAGCFLILLRSLARTLGAPLGLSDFLLLLADGATSAVLALCWLE